MTLLTSGLITEPLESGVVLISLEGRLDASAAPGFQSRMAAVIDEGKTRLAVDLAQVSFIDSSGLGVLVTSLKAARRASCLSETPHLDESGITLSRIGAS
jgi:anti-sigma B factor antagonist